jgi:uncharacterized protein YhdP
MPENLHHRRPSAKRKQILIWAGALITGVVFILAALLLIAPRILDGEKIRQKIELAVARQTGGQVHIGQLALDFFPSPCTIISDVRFEFSETVSGTLKSLALFPDMVDLILGQMGISQIRIESPAITIDIPLEPKKGTQKDDDSFQSRINSSLANIAKKALDISVKVENGRILVKRQEGNNLNLSGLYLAANLSTDPNGAQINLAKLAIETPRLNISGQFEADQLRASTTSKMKLALYGKQMDVEGIRQALLQTAGENAVISAIFSVVGGGQISELFFRTQGESLKNLGELANMTIEASLIQGRIKVPFPKLDLTEVEGRVAISKGVLRGEKLKARLDDTKGYEGTLVMGLLGKSAPFQLDLGVDADLAVLPPVLAQVIKSEAFAKELARFQKIRGHAVGRLILGDRLDAITARIDVSNFNLTGMHAVIPVPVIIENGRFLYDSEMMAVTDTHLKFLDSSVHVEKFSIARQENNIEALAADFTLDANRYNLTGNAHFINEGVKLDMALGADTIDLNRLLKAFETHYNEKARKPSDLRVRGLVKVKADHFIYKGFSWRPLNADVSIEKDMITVTVTEGQLCGITTAGILQLGPDVLSLDFGLKAFNQNISETITCMVGKPNKIIGQFDLDGKLIAHGPVKSIIDALSGEFRVTTRDGRIYQMDTLAKLHETLNFTNLFRDKFPGMGDQGFYYVSSHVYGKIADGKLIVKEGFVDGKTMKIAYEGKHNFKNQKVDFTVLVAPLKTVNKVVGWIPVVGHILGDTLTTVPMRVFGPLKNPAVIPLSPKAVGDQLLGVMERTLTLPFKIIEPVIVKDKNE